MSEEPQTTAQALQEVEGWDRSIAETIQGQDDWLSRDEQARFPQGGSALLYNKVLEHKAFRITSEPRFAREPKKTGKRSDGSAWTVDAHDVVQFLIRAVDKQTYEVDKLARLATLSGGYLLNQVRTMLDTGMPGRAMLFGTVWTVARNEAMPKFEGYHPFMLAVYSERRDRDDHLDPVAAQSDPSVFDEEKPYGGHDVNAAQQVNEREAFAQWLFKELEARHENYEQVAQHAGVARSEVNSWTRQQWEWYFKQVDKEAKLKERKAGSAIR